MPQLTATGRLQVHGYCMFREGKQAKVRYPTAGMGEDVAGRSFHNGRFVQRLRQAAASQPRVTVRQGTVTRLLDGAALQAAFARPAVCQHSRHGSKQHVQQPSSSRSMPSSLDARRPAALAPDLHEM